jgi:hypothetical protein
MTIEDGSHLCCRNHDAGLILRDLEGRRRALRKQNKTRALYRCFLRAANPNRTRTDRAYGKNASISAYFHAGFDPPDGSTRWALSGCIGRCRTGKSPRKDRRI